MTIDLSGSRNAAVRRKQTQKYSLTEYKQWEDVEDQPQKRCINGKPGVHSRHQLVIDRSGANNKDPERWNNPKAVRF